MVPGPNATPSMIATARYFDSWAQTEPATRIAIELHVADAATTAGVLQIAKNQLPLVATCSEKQGRTAVPDWTNALALVPLPSGLPVDGVWVHNSFDSTAVNVHGDIETLVLVSGSARVNIFQTVNVRGTFNKDEFVRITKLVAQRLADATR